MSTHAATRAGRRPGGVTPAVRRRRVRLRALLALGLVGLLFTTGTYAYWTDSAPIDGGNLTSATLDLKVGGSDSATTTTLSMGAMVPGSSSAEVLTVQNAGTASLRYALLGGLAGADAAAYNTAAALQITVSAGGTRSGSGSAATCTGGTTLVSGAALTSVTATEIVALRGPLAPGASVSLCVQVTLSTTAPSSLQGRSASLSLTASGTSDLG